MTETITSKAEFDKKFQEFDKKFLEFLENGDGETESTPDDDDDDDYEGLDPGIEVDNEGDGEGQPIDAQEWYKVCKEDCDEENEKKKYPTHKVCSNSGRTFDSVCHLMCDFYFQDIFLKTKFIGACDDPNKVPLPPKTKPADDPNKIDEPEELYHF